jgi:hypothetical protein
MNQKGEIIFNEPTSLLVPPVDTPIHQTIKVVDDIDFSPLLSINAIFPFDLFPDQVLVDADKVTIINRNAFGTQQISSVLIENISHVDVFTGILTATLNITDSSNFREPLYITAHNLSISDALKARKLLQELITSKKHQSVMDYKKIGYQEESSAEVKTYDMQTPIPHYYGDLVRKLLIVAAVMIMLTIPIFPNIYLLPIAVLVVIIFALTTLAGILNPKQMIFMVLVGVVSTSLYFVFENNALYYFGAEDKDLYTWINQSLAILFLITIYFSIKTIRGFLQND